MSKKLNREIKCIDHLQGHNKRQGFSHYTDRDIRSNVLFAPNQWNKVICKKVVPKEWCKESNLYIYIQLQLEAKDKKTSCNEAYMNLLLYTYVGVSLPFDFKNVYPWYFCRNIVSDVIFLKTKQYKHFIIFDRLSFALNFDISYTSSINSNLCQD